MKRNEIFNRLTNIKSLAQWVKIDHPSLYCEIDSLLRDVDMDRHQKYDEFEMMEDVIQQLAYVKQQVKTLESNIDFIKYRNRK